jgi:hypothetical protein
MHAQKRLTAVHVGRVGTQPVREVQLLEQGGDGVGHVLWGSQPHGTGVLSAGRAPPPPPPPRRRDAVHLLLAAWRTLCARDGARFAHATDVARSPTIWRRVRKRAGGRGVQLVSMRGCVGSAGSSVIGRLCSRRRPAEPVQRDEISVMRSAAMRSAAPPHTHTQAAQCAARGGTRRRRVHWVAVPKAMRARRANRRHAPAAGAACPPRRSPTRCPAARRRTAARPRRRCGSAPAASRP